MKRYISALASLLAVAASPAWAHTGPEAMDRHFTEHLAIALAIGLPVIYGLVRMLSGSDKKER
jgi:GTPase